MAYTSHPMKSLLSALFILIALIGVCYYWSEKMEPDDVSEGANSANSADAAVPTPETAKEEAVIELMPEPTEPIKSFPKATGYYAAVANLKDAELKEGLHKIIRGHRVLSYRDLWEALRDLDRGDDAKVILIYDRSQRSHSKNGGNQGDWNREHLWPRAYGVRRSSPANTDLHHIRASDVRINGKRGHLYFDKTEGEDFLGKRYSSDPNSWEPPNEVKGDIARAMFYMAVRYEGNEAGSIDLELSNVPDLTKGVHGKLSTLLRWHKTDPVSDEERTRNDKIHRSYQGNRNPFIDHPEWAEWVYN